MIYLLDDFSFPGSHGIINKSIISHWTCESVTMIQFDQSIRPNQLETYDSFKLEVSWSDVIVCPWIVSSNFGIDNFFEDLSMKSNVVVSAGNFGQDIINFSPARVMSAITVGCLNKLGNRAKFSNFSNHKEMVWVPGTNYLVDNKSYTGTSVSACIYSGILAESIRLESSEYLEYTITKFKKTLLDKSTTD